MLFFTRNVTQHVQKARKNMSRSDTPCISDTTTFKLINEACFNDQPFFIFVTDVVLCFITLCYGLKMSEYEAYWLMGFYQSLGVPGSNYCNLFSKADKQA